jgi:hypothetical protein
VGLPRRKSGLVGICEKHIGADDSRRYALARFLRDFDQVPGAGLSDNPRRHFPLDKGRGPGEHRARIPHFL